MHSGCRVAVLLALAAGASSLEAQESQPRLQLVDTATVQAPRLGEASGIVASRRHPGLYWTHNDSGDRPILYVTDSTGADLGRVSVDGAAAEDWEDISIGPCTQSPGSCLFIGDIGDNDGRRPSVSVYVVPEPEPPASSDDTARVVTPEDTLVLRYPDHPHDAEAIAVIGGWIYLVTKDRFGPAVMYRSPTHVSGPRVLAPVATLPITTSALRGRLVTGAAVSDNGRLLLLRTYVSIHPFLMAEGLPIALSGREGLTIPIVETQGEGIAVDLHGLVVLIGERGGRNHAIVARVRIDGTGN
jgi:hypothetical protein